MGYAKQKKTVAPLFAALQQQQLLLLQLIRVY